MIQTDHIDEAYQWLCKQRRNYPDNSDIWHLRFHWQTKRDRIIKTLDEGTYTFAPLQSITRRDGTTLHMWSSADALVLKALTLAITPRLPCLGAACMSKGTVV